MTRVRAGRLKGKGGWIFLALVLLLTAAVTLVSPPVSRVALAYFFEILLKVLPVLALVFCLMFVFNLFMDRQRIQRYFGYDSGVTGWLIALFSGAIASGPPYPWYALMGELKRKGMRSALITGFLYSRAIKLPLVPLMFHYFGTLYTVILAFYIMLFAVINGLLMEKLESRQAGCAPPGRP